MITIRKSSDRGTFRNDWLTSQHSFSFGEYYDPDYMGFSLLRVINDDRVAAEGGFGTHGHSEMEIITYALAGTLEHKDSTGSGDVIRRGDIQRMSAGTGIKHSEFNPSHVEDNHFLQIWLTPTLSGVKPGYVQQHFSDEDKDGRLCLVVSSDGSEGSIMAHSDAAMYASLLNGKQSLDYQLATDRVGYLHVAKGKLSLNGEALDSGDAALISAGSNLDIAQATHAEFLLFDLPAT